MTSLHASSGDPSGKPEDSASPTDALLGGRYRLGDLLGRGGMASVYRAEDEMLGRTVAVKIFSDEPGPQASADRKRSEVRVLASLNHPALVTIFDANVETATHPYLVMELVDGPTLHTRLQSGPLLATDAVATVKDLSEALAVVHAAGIVHRDIKPSNVLLTQRSGDRAFRPKLADFGIATIADSTRLTMPGTLIGTAAYLAPEQLRDSTPAAAADIYSLGLVVLECLTGERAFPGTPAESMSARMFSNPVMPQSVPVALRKLIADMTARNPEDRPTAADVARQAELAQRELLSGGSSDELVTMPVVEDAAQDAPTLLLTEPDAPTLLLTERMTATPQARLRRTRLWALIVAGVFVAALCVGVAASFPTTPASPPELPATEAPLSTHLQQLLETVTP